MKRINSHSLRKGFTLVELMVAVSIFAIVLTMSMGAILSILDANRKAQAVSSVMDNLNAAVESLTRTVKTNTNYIVSDGGTGITVTDDDSEDRPTMEYYFSEEDVDGETRGAIYFRDGRTDEDVAIPITAPEVDVDDFAVERIAPNGEDGEECYQPKVLINVKGTAGVNDRVRTTFAIQTVVSQRDLNLTADCF
jgi:prepilin-type N-terminal cleavage/methylation domain-containing protein